MAGRKYFDTGGYFGSGSNRLQPRPPAEKSVALANLLVTFFRQKIKTGKEMIKDLKEVTENLRYVINAPIVNMMVFFGLVFIALSFFGLDGIKTITLVASPRWPMLIIGSILTFAGLTVFLLTREERRINKKARIEKGISIKLGRILVKLELGKIQEISNLNKTTAVVLPANTTFINDCITDKNSALGSFMMDHYPAKISEITKVIEERLKISGVPRNNDNTYPLGTTIILPQPYDTPINILITAATIRKEKIGIRAEPTSICECIRQVFVATSDKKISKLRMPILGSGHGGLEINTALLFLILGIRHYSNCYHHVKSVHIVVTENDAKRLKDIYRLQYLALLEGASK